MGEESKQGTTFITPSEMDISGGRIIPYICGQLVVVCEKSLRLSGPPRKNLSATVTVFALGSMGRRKPALSEAY